MLHGADQANCTEKYRRQTISNGGEERPPQRRTLRQEGERTGRWCWEYSSDETPDENAPQPAEGAQAPKRMKKQIHLTLPMSPAHVTTTETFSTFFINHGLTRALQKALAKKGWSTNQMREFVTNFQKKHGQQVPMPKIYGDEDSTDDEGPELADGTKAVKKKTTGGAPGGDQPQYQR